MSMFFLALKAPPRYLGIPTNFLLEVLGAGMIWILFLNVAPPLCSKGD